jgi:hypothetical protein
VYEVDSFDDFTDTCLAPTAPPVSARSSPGDHAELKRHNRQKSGCKCSKQCGRSGISEHDRIKGECNTAGRASASTTEKKQVPSM